MSVFRQMLSKVNKDQSFVNEEKDPSEFLRAIETHFHYAPMKTINVRQRPKADFSNLTSTIVCKYLRSESYGHSAFPCCFRGDVRYQS